MKIGFDACRIVEQKTGVGIYAAELLFQFSQLNNPHSITLFHNSLYKMPQPVPADYPVRTSLRHRVLFWNILDLPKMIRKEKIDLFHAPYNFGGPLRKMCPLVISVHDLIPVLFPSHCSRKFRTIAALSYRISIPQADIIIASSEATKRDIVRLYGYENKIRVIPLGVSAHFRVIKDTGLIEQSLKRLHLPCEYILYVGKLEVRKNVTTTLAAYAALMRQAKRPGDIPPLVLIGKPGVGFDQIQRQIAAEKLGSFVHHLNYVAEDDLPLVFNGARLFVFPSFYEGFGLPPLEAMACGVPVICSNTSSLPEVVGDSGVLTRPDDVQSLKNAMQDVLFNHDYASHLSEKGIARAALFSWRHTALKTLSVYEEVFNS
ncbi:MAG: glycosyltransferase family 4 protein [Candidatus Magnetominusculus sp. LBB02]|nr:glycosyltransferase family 4 protein [Candidatus Magnetominusculus sp. LBB02]